MAANYYNSKSKKNASTQNEGIDKILTNYYNALMHLKNQKWQESIALIDEIYRNINGIQLTKIKKECRDMIEQIRNVNTHIENENEAMIKSPKPVKKIKNNKNMYLIEQSISVTAESTTVSTSYGNE